MGDKELQGPSSIVTYLILFTSEDWVRNSGKRGDTSRAKFTLGGRDIGNVLRIQLNIFTHLPSYFLPPQKLNFTKLLDCMTPDEEHILRNRPLFSREGHLGNF